MSNFRKGDRVILRFRPHPRYGSLSIRPEMCDRQVTVVSDPCRDGSCTIVDEHNHHWTVIDTMLDPIILSPFEQSVKDYIQRELAP